MKRTNRNTRRGFTLVEMLIVLAILVGLAAMVVPRLLGTQKKADISNAKAQIGMIKGCLQNYFLDMKNFPTTEQGLDALVAAPAGGEEGTETVASSNNWNGPYTESGELPVDPWGNQYQYAYPPTNSKSDTPDIWSFGPDGQDNTEDDITSWTREAGEGGTESGDMSEYDDYQEAPPAAEPQP